MWRDKQIKFLTESEFSESELINVLKEDCSNFENNSEKKILQQIIDDFEKKDFSLLSTLEISYLTRNSKEKWTPYLIHRHKFHFYETICKYRIFHFILFLNLFPLVI